MVRGNLGKLISPTLFLQTNNRKLWPKRRPAPCRCVSPLVAQNHSLALCGCLEHLWTSFQFSKNDKSNCIRFSKRLLGHSKFRCSVEDSPFLLQAPNNVAITSEVLLLSSWVPLFLLENKTQTHFFPLLLCFVWFIAQCVQFVLCLSFNFRHCLADCCQDQTNKKKSLYRGLVNFPSHPPHICIWGNRKS